MIAPFRIGLLGLCVLLPSAAVPAGASSDLDAGVAAFRMEDRFGRDCIAPVDGNCFFDADLGAEPGAASVDAFQRIESVRVSTDFSAARQIVGSLWLLPDESLVLHGPELYVRHPAFRMATETWNSAPDDLVAGSPYRPALSPDNVTLHYFGPSAHEASAPPRDRTWSMEYGREQGVRYESVGPYNVQGNDSTDSYLEEAEGACFDSTDCHEVAHEVVLTVHDFAPNVMFGLEFYDVEVNINSTAGALVGKASQAGGDWKSAPGTELRSVGKSKAQGNVNVTPFPPFPVNPAPSSWSPQETSVSRARAAPFNGQEAPPAEDPHVLAVVAAVTAALVILVALYAKLRGRKEILGAQARRRLLELAGQRPGITMSQAAHQMGLSWNAVAHHARVLQRIQALRLVKSNRRICLYVAGAVPRTATEEALENPVRGRLVRALVASPEGLTRKELHGILAETPKRTRNHALRQMVEHRLVRAVVGPDGAERYQLSTVPVPAALPNSA